MIARWVQSRTVSLPHWILPFPHHNSPSVIHAPTCKATIRHGLVDVHPGTPFYAIRVSIVAKRELRFPAVLIHELVQLLPFVAEV